jgi:hypothetical protein
VALSASTGVRCTVRTGVEVGPTVGLVGRLRLGGMDGGVWGSRTGLGFLSTRQPNGHVLATLAREKDGQW